MPDKPAFPLALDEQIHILEGSKLVSSYFDQDSLQAAHISALATLRGQLLKESSTPRAKSLPGLRKELIAMLQELQYPPFPDIKPADYRLGTQHPDHVFEIMADAILLFFARQS